MASRDLPLLAFTILVLIFSSQPISASRNFIKSSCNTTTYPSLCYKTLKPYASSVGSDPRKLCNAALSASLAAAADSSTTISKVSNQTGLTSQETAVVQDCQENIDDSRDRVEQSIEAFRNVRGSGDSQMDDVKTWMSAAITDYSTCTDEFEDFKVRASVKRTIKKSVSRSSKVTSFTLSFVNKFNV